MATLEKIRQRSRLLILVIGLAMLAFILTDLFSSGNSLLLGGVNVVGSVNGDKIDIQDFSKKMEDARVSYISNTGDQAFNNVTEKQFADQVWNSAVREMILGEIQESNGFTLTNKELFQRVISHQSIATNQSFLDPQTGLFNEDQFRSALANIRDNVGVEPQAAEIWSNWLLFEDAIGKQSLTDKFNKAIQMGIYYPSNLARQDYLDQNDAFQTNYVALRYDVIADSTVEVSISEMNAYIQKNLKVYDRKEEERAITYVTFPIKPSADDRNQLLAELNELKDGKVLPNSSGKNDTIFGFDKTENDSLFVVANSELPYDGTFYKREDLSPELDSTIWEASAGFVYGPYEEDGMWQLIKVVKKMVVPDSVRAKHILISVQGATRAAETVTRSPQEGKQLADSLFAVLEKDPSSFEAVSNQFNDDAVAKTKGGDLNWFGQRSMAKPFADFCFYNKAGKLGFVITEFGFHIVEITAQKGDDQSIRVARIARKLTPSEATLDNTYTEASNFASSIGDMRLAAMAESKGMSPRPLNSLKIFDENLSGLGNNRDVVRWAFKEESKVDDVQLFTGGTENYVIVQLDKVYTKGVPSAEELEPLVKPKIITEKKKDMMVKKLAEASTTASSLEELATALGMASDQVRQQKMGFSQANVNGIGGEPSLMGYLSGLSVNSISKPFGGERAAYVAIVTEHTEVPDPGFYDDVIKRNQDPMRTRVTNGLFDALEKEARIKDMRAKFY